MTRGKHNHGHKINRIFYCCLQKQNKKPTTKNSPEETTEIETNQYF